MGDHMKEILAVVAAWEKLPVGRHSPRVFERWVEEDVWPQIMNLRRIIPEESRSEVTKEALRRYG